MDHGLTPLTTRAASARKVEPAQSTENLPRLRDEEGEDDVIVGCLPAARKYDACHPSRFKCHNVDGVCLQHCRLLKEYITQRIVRAQSRVRRMLVRIYRLYVDVIVAVMSSDSDGTRWRKRYFRRNRNMGASAIHPGERVLRGCSCRSETRMTSSARKSLCR